MSEKIKPLTVDPETDAFRKMTSKSSAQRPGSARGTLKVEPFVKGGVMPKPVEADDNSLNLSVDGRPAQAQSIPPESWEDFNKSLRDKLGPRAGVPRSER